MPQQLASAIEPAPAPCPPPWRHRCHSCGCMPLVQRQCGCRWLGGDGAGRNTCGKSPRQARVGAAALAGIPPRPRAVRTMRSRVATIRADHAYNSTIRRAPISILDTYMHCICEKQLARRPRPGVRTRPVRRRGTPPAAQWPYISDCDPEIIGPVIFNSELSLRSQGGLP